MGRLVGGNARMVVLCTVALLWAWEVTADDPESVGTAAAAARAESPNDLSFPWNLLVTADRVRVAR